MAVLLPDVINELQILIEAILDGCRVDSIVLGCEFQSAVIVLEPLLLREVKGTQVDTSPGGQEVEET